MKEKHILSDNQRRLLSLLSSQKTIADNFYLSGGTALAEFYLKHRFSEDLDFFSENEFEPQSISVILKKIGKQAGVKNIRFEQSFNRNLFFLELSEDNIKTEFTYFPFPRIEFGKKFEKLKVDSMFDIAVNKIFTIYQKPRSRDFIDLYFILREKKEWTIAQLAASAKIKFDHHIDLLQLGARFISAEELKDYPRMVAPLEHKKWQEFFKKEAEKFSNEILN